MGKFFARNLGGLARARTRAAPAREGNSRTPSMYANEKSDEVVVPTKRPNKGRQLPAEVVEGRASPEGNSRQAAVVRTLSRVATSIRLAAVRRTACDFQTARGGVRPEGGARCVSSARRDLCGGRSVMAVPTATMHRTAARSPSGVRASHPKLLLAWRFEPRGSLRCSLSAGGDQRIVHRIADATRCGPLGRKDGRVPRGAAIGNEQHFIVTALHRTVRRIAIGADDPNRGGHAGGACRALFTRGPGRSRITLLALRPFSAAHEADG